MPPEADAQAWVTLVCSKCGLPFDILHPSEAVIQKPVCPPCRLIQDEEEPTLGGIADA